MLPKAFKAVVHCEGLCIPVPGGSPLRGFYTVRSAVAMAPGNAEAALLRNFRRESKVRRVIEQSNGSCRVSVSEIQEISLWRWLFELRKQGWSFYQDDDIG